MSYFAVDIGTTTINAGRIEPSAGTVRAAFLMNPQSLYGRDVVSRVNNAKRPKVRQKLVQAVNEAIKELMDELFSDERPKGIIVAANTVMTHLFLGLNTDGFASAPFEADSLDLIHGRFCEIPMTVLPAVGPFIGGDIVSGIYDLGLWKMSGKTLFVDLGTNGEMILCSDGMLSGTSVAAGPAFEGGNISCGMTAKEGAIFDVEIKRGFCRCHVLGDAPACGLCGSGLFAVVNELLREGIIDERGTFVDEDHRRDGYILARVPYGKNVVITQDDIRAFQTAKAAVRAGAEALLYKVGISFSMIEQVFIAGNFGESIRPEYITGCGMLPEKVRDRISFVGNTSLEGAAKLALSPEDEPKLSEIASGVSELMIAEDEVFRELFVKRMDFERES